MRQQVMAFCLKIILILSGVVLKHHCSTVSMYNMLELGTLQIFFSLFENQQIERKSVSKTLSSAGP
jgi:hypothetical protein